MRLIQSSSRKMDLHTEPTVFSKDNDVLEIALRFLTDWEGVIVDPDKVIGLACKIVCRTSKCHKMASSKATRIYLSAQIT